MLDAGCWASYNIFDGFHLECTLNSKNAWLHYTRSLNTALSTKIDSQEPKESNDVSF